MIDNSLFLYLPIELIQNISGLWLSSTERSKLRQSCNDLNKWIIITTDDKKQMGNVLLTMIISQSNKIYIATYSLTLTGSDWKISGCALSLMNQESV